MPIYEWKRQIIAGGDPWDGDDGQTLYYDTEHTTTEGSIHDPIPVPEGEGWVRQYNYQVGKVSGVGDSPSRSVKSR